MINKSGREALAAVPSGLRASAQREADLDLLARLSKGSLVYPAMLLLLGVTTPYRTDHPYLFWPAVLITAIALALRFAVGRFRDQLCARRRIPLILLLFVSVCLSGGVAGVVLLTVAMNYGFASWTFSVTMMWMAGIASGSTISFTPNFAFLLVQLFLVLAPVTCYEFSLASSQGVSLGLATVVFLGFHVVQGLRLNGMYWDLGASRVLEKLRIQELEAAKSAAEEAQERLHYQATHDNLTGLLNHAQILSVFDQERERSLRQGIPLGIMMLDLDYFKQVNDHFGHLGGDEVLRTVAERVRSSLRPCDAVGRYGGEEFLVILPGCNVGDCAASAERIRQRIECEAVPHEHTKIQVTASIGVTVLDPNTESGQSPIIARADKALYKAKRNGKNRVEIDSVESGMIRIVDAGVEA